MADERTKILIELDLDKGSFKRTEKKAENLGEDIGETAGKSASKNFKKESQQGFTNAFDGLKKAAIAAGAAIGAALAGRAVINAAIRQEEAVNSLNASLRSIGEFSKQTTNELQAFASELQSITTLGDEAILEQLSFAQALGATADQSKEIVAASADLAAALNIDLTSATRNVARTLGGFAGELGEVIPELRNLTKEQLQSGAAIDLLAKKFDGLAEAQTRTFGGALTQTVNTLGDFFEEVGNLIIKTPEVTALFIAFGQVVRSITTSLANSSGGIREFIGNGVNLLTASIRNAALVFGLFKDQITDSALFQILITGFNTVSSVVTRNFIPALNAVFNVTNGLRNSFLTFVNFTIGNLFRLFRFLDSGLSSLGVDTGFKDQINAVIDELDINVANFGKSAKENFSKLFDPESLQNGNEFVDAFNELITRAKSSAIDEETGESSFSKIFAPFSEENLNAISERIKSFSSESSSNLKSFGKTTGEVAKKATFDLEKRLAAGVSGGIQNITQSIINGENAFANFGKFLLGIFGDLAIQLGSFFIAQGIAIEALNAISGTGAIAAGAALVALGTILKSFTGGASSPLAGANTGGAGVGGGIAGAGIGGDESVLTGPDERQEPETRIAVNIAGDVLDSRETGLRIVDLLNDAFDRDGAIVTGGI